MSRDGFAAAISGFGRHVRKFVLAAAVLTLITGAGSSLARAAAVAPPAQTKIGPLKYTYLSCHGLSFCIALSSPRPGGQIPGALAEWNGRTWHILPRPGPLTSVFSVSCGGPTFCLAVTGQGTVVAWNGRAWRKFPQPPFGLSYITCESSVFCATWDNIDESLSGGTPQIAQWNGKRWQIMPNVDLPCGGPMCQVQPPLICGSTTNCTIQGSYCPSDENCDNVINFAESWNGISWQPTTFTILGNEECAGRSFCMNLQLVHGNCSPSPCNAASAQVTRDWGHNWHDASKGLAAACLRFARCGLDPLASCGSSWSCMALPFSLQSIPPPVALAWNGSAWKTIPLARASGRIPDLTLLSCGAAKSCVAIGTYKRTPSSAPQPVAEHWDGKAWHVMTMPSSA
jgi:hypothetical protein